MSPRFCLALILALLLPVAAGAADAETDWKAVTDLDAGPHSKPASQQEARAAAANHLALQERALRTFLAGHVGDPHVFEAEMRLARLLQIRAGMEESEGPRNEANHILGELDKTATGDQRVEVDFARIAYQMRLLHNASLREREQLLLATQRFQGEHPTDRRVPRLLAEVAGLFDAEPQTKRSLLLSAQAVAQDAELKARLADDLKRLDLLGKTISLRFTTAQSRPVDLAESRGKVVLLVFFADFSPPSIDALVRIQRVAKDLPADRLRVLALSLDNKLEVTMATIARYGVTWPVGFDGKGWESPAVRALGINTLPTVWLIDQAGVLRSLNALDSTADQVWKLLRKPGGREESGGHRFDAAYGDNMKGTNDHNRVFRFRHGDGDLLTKNCCIFRMIHSKNRSAADVDLKWLKGDHLQKYADLLKHGRSLQKNAFIASYPPAHAPLAAPPRPLRRGRASR